MEQTDRGSEQQVAPGCASLDAVLETICSFLDVRQILVMERVCKAWAKIIRKGTYLWRTFVQQVDPAIVALPSDIPSWKECFKTLWPVVGYWDFTRIGEPFHVYVRSPDSKVMMNNTAAQHSGVLAHVEGQGLNVENGAFFQTDTKDSSKLFDMRVGFTVEVWIWPKRFHSISWQNTLLSKHGWGSGWELRTDGDQAEFLVTVKEGGHQVASYIEKGLVPLEKWTHLAGVISKDSQCSLFVNGQLKASFRVRPPFKDDAATVVGIGRNIFWHDRYFNGYIASARVTRAALLPSQFLPRPFQHQN